MRPRTSSSKPCSQPTLATASWLKSRARVRRSNSRFRLGHRSHWTAPPTSSTASPCTAVSIALTVKGKVEQAVVYRPYPQRPVHRHQGPWRLPERAPHPREQAHPAQGLPDLHRLPLPPWRQLQELHEHDQRRDATHGWPAPPRCCQRSIWLTWLQALPTASLKPACPSGTWLQARCWVTEAGGLIGNFTGEADFMEQRDAWRATPACTASSCLFWAEYRQDSPALVTRLPCARLPLKTTLPRAPALLKKSPPTRTHQQARATHRSEPMS